MKFRLVFSILLLSTVFISARSNNSNEYFYYYNGGQITLPVDSSRLFVVTNGMFEFSLANSPEDLTVNDYGISLVQNAVCVDSVNNSLGQAGIFPVYMTSIGLIDDIAESRYNRIVDSLNTVSNVLQVLPSFELGGKRIDVTNNFYVKLRSTEDLSLLEDMTEEYGISIIGYNEYMPLWYTLSCDKDSELNSIDAANIFYESGFFEASEPEFSYYDLAQSNDTYYASQWGINNTGQYNVGIGIDINVLDAWEITKGNGVKVAVYDQGIELNHPDLVDNISSLSFDAQTNSSPSTIRGSHGTACAGIIGATQNNGEGITGVAPEAELISVSLALLTSNTPQQIANGFNWAWRNGADIISNSWGGYVRSSIIDEAVREALNNGRDGKGTVVVFAAGNDYKDNASILYPGNRYSEILVVGGMSYSGERKSFTSADGESWQSCYGEELDVVAPCVKIHTTDLIGYSGYSNGNYHSSFNGTSSACPYVAGAAALVLSVNPNLTVGEVNDIIETTAQKVRTDLYAYTTVENRTNGTWNVQMGYGLVDATAAVIMASSDVYNTTYIKNETITKKRTISNRYVELENVQIRGEAEVIINATERVLLKQNTIVGKYASMKIL